LEQIHKSLSEFLNSKREAFPRFYFLANEELLQILSNSKDIKSVQKYMIKCFEGISSLVFDGDMNIEAMKSPEGELVKFGNVIQTTKMEENEETNEIVEIVRNVEDWLNDVEKEMISTLQRLTLRCLEDVHKTHRTNWISAWPSQVILSVNNTTWTSMTELAIQ
jgi:dynein heavy chain